MGTTRRPSTLHGGLDLDPDLPLVELNWPQLQAAHVMRHLQRHLQAEGRELVLIGDVDGFQSQTRIPDEELWRYRWAESPKEITKVLRWEPDAVPLFTMCGSSCLGFHDLNWRDVKVARHMSPGRLFAFCAPFAHMNPAALRTTQHRLHLCAWQAPFPRRSLVSWGNDAELLRGPQRIVEYAIAGRAMHTGEPANDGSVPSVEDWFLAQEELLLHHADQ